MALLSLSGYPRLLCQQPSIASCRFAAPLHSTLAPTKARRALRMRKTTLPHARARAATALRTRWARIVRRRRQVR